MPPVCGREVAAETGGSFSTTAIGPSYGSASQYANEVPRIPPPTIVTSQGSMVRFRGSAPSLLCLCTCDTARRCLPTDLNPDGPDGPVERDGGIHDAPPQLRRGPQAGADIGPHGAVVPPG